ncbi:MAG: DEAD/DEAH box helicase family protein [Candidatus Aenigmatarchaeota archaeon]
MNQMTQISLILKNIAENVDENQLEVSWRNLDFENFSFNKKLYDFQKEALLNAVKVLWIYYQNSSDYHLNETFLVNEKRKQYLYKHYKDWGITEDVDYDLKNKKNKLLEDYYPKVNNKISFENFVNRMSFWMATGSGKTLVIIKLIETLQNLIKRKEIPPYDILFLTYREDLIKQFKQHLDEYNSFNSSNRININDLKNYEKIKNSKDLFSKIQVFYYRADLFSDEEEKEKKVDFKNYFNDGKWYIILDEAHKGDKEDSKRQQIFSILSKNGFLFNFSATFDDIRDFVSCVYEINLSSFISKGFGKKIYVSDYEIQAFKADDLSDFQKQKVILKTLLLFCYIKKKLEEIRKFDKFLYHNPLLLILVNTVNFKEKESQEKEEIKKKTESDLKLVFETLRQIAEGNFKKEIINKAKQELIDEFNKNDTYIFSDDIGKKLNIDYDLIKEITYEDILFYAFNSKIPSKIEISYNPKDRSEVAFKLKTSDSHFALSKTGDMPDWLKEELNRYDVNHQFEEEGYFAKLNEDSSTINILLGSRVFYEGWDSNRPNIIMYVNIGTQKEARKFVLQSIGRGVRIEPIKNKRKRFLYIKQEYQDLYDKVKNFVNDIESLFVFGTNKIAIETILSQLKSFKKEYTPTQLYLFKNKLVEDKILLVPKYKYSNVKLYEDVKSRFAISKEDLDLLRKYLEFIKDNRIIMLKYSVEHAFVEFLRASLKETNVEKFYKEITDNILDVDLLLLKLKNFWEAHLQEFDRFDELKNEIKHYENIVVRLEELEIDELKQKVEKVSEYKNAYNQLQKQFQEKNIKDFDTFVQQMQCLKKEETFIKDGKEILIKYIDEHYYLPILMSKSQKIEYIQHIINTESEYLFIQQLDNYLSPSNKNNKFKDFDWWCFSKIDQTLDDIFIPYYSFRNGCFLNFKPDFIFWLKRKNDYFIVFVDPKSTIYRDFEEKILGYKEIFEVNDKPKVFDFKELKCRVYCYLGTSDVDKIKSSAYKNYWFENIDTIFDKLL